MRLLNVTQSYYPFMDMGGPTVKVRALARGMASFGHSVTVLTADYGLDSAQIQLVNAIASRWGYESSEDGVQTVYLRTHARYRALTWNAKLAQFCREKLNYYDILHIYGLYDFMGPRVARSARRIGRPYVVEPMGMFRPIVRKIRLKRLYHSLLGNPLLAGASRIIATSDQERDEFAEGGIPAHKIVVRRNGIDVPARFPEAGHFRNQWGIAPDVTVVLFLGRLVSKKSPDLLIDAFSRWRQRTNGSRKSTLILAGPDEGDGFRQRLQAQATRIGLQGEVLFTGPLYAEAKWAAYRDADVFVLPSQNENFGNTAAEAVASGTPVLVTDCCGIAPIVDGRAGLVVRHDPADIESGLAQILDDPTYHAQLRDGCEAVARSLGWAEPLVEMEAVYQTVLQEAHPQ